jgi:anti-anti-sigma factor
MPGTLVETLPTFELKAFPDHAQLILLPGLNEANWSDVEQVGSAVLAKLKESSTNKLLVDLSKLNYMGSSQVALLVRVWKALKPMNGRIAVLYESNVVRDVLSIAGLKGIWDICPKREIAMAALGIRVPVEVPTPAPRSEGTTDIEDTDTGIEAVRLCLGILFASFIALALAQLGPWGPSRLLIGLQLLLAAGAICTAIWTAALSSGIARQICFGVAITGAILGGMGAMQWGQSPKAAPASKEEATENSTEATAEGESAAEGSTPSGKSEPTDVPPDSDS